MEAGKNSAADSTPVPVAQSAVPVAQGAVRAALRPFLHLPSRPEQAAFSCARFVCAACEVEGPWQHQNPTNVTETLRPFLHLSSLKARRSNLNSGQSSGSFPVISSPYFRA